MLRRHFLTAAGLLGTAGLMPHFTWAQIQPSASDSGPVNRFGIDLYHRVRQRPGNLFISPLSISVALSMTAAGAEGNTLAEMARALHLPADDPEHRSIRRLMAVIDAERTGTEDKASPDEMPKDGQSGLQLSMANAIYVQRGYTLRREFQQIVTDSYSAALESVDFAADAEAVRQQINRSVRSQTQGKIRELFAPSTLDALTRLVLANAIYFKGTWQAEFDSQLTAAEPFSRADGSRVDVPMMRRKGDYKLLETPAFQMLEMPYQGGDAAMLVLLPRRADALPELEQRMTAERWSQWSEQLTHVTDLQLYIPKFKLETQYTLNDTLQQMGIRDAFDDRRADFSAMVSEQPEGRLAISTVVHKAYCDVDEQGTEAAAATGVAIGITSLVIEEPKVFKADRPFVFAIRHNPTNSLLFIGRVSDPTV